MARRHRSHRRRHLGETSEMAVYDPSKPSKIVGINWKSPWVWGSALAAVGLAFFLWPKKAKADAKGKPKDVTTPVGLETGGSSTGASAATVRDPGSGVPVAGPTGKLNPVVSYTVQKGESWSNIASRTYGDYRWWPALWDFNRSGGTKFQNPDTLRVGDTIQIPELPLSNAAFRQAVFARAEADREWAIAKYKAQKAKRAFNTPRPASTFEAMPIPKESAPPGSTVTAQLSPAAGGGGGTSSQVAPALPPQAPREPTTEEELEAYESEASAKLAKEAR